jgi:hypothetical protein
LQKFIILAATLFGFAKAASVRKYLRYFIVGRNMGNHKMIVMGYAVFHNTRIHSINYAVFVIQLTSFCVASA